MQKTQEHPENEYLVSSEVLQLAKISRRTLERWVADGKLPSVKIGGFGSRRYKRSDIDALLRGTAAPVTPSSATPRPDEAPAPAEPVSPEATGSAGAFVAPERQAG